ncbi:MAG TPA: hypothetical protein VF322_00405 [Gammaproteobacteria bacterium]
MSAKIDGVNAAATTKADDSKDAMVAMKDELASAKVWTLALYVALAGGLFGTMARGFGWL